jgi:uncharacterized damage-inducible protein DinB
MSQVESYRAKISSFIDQILDTVESLPEPVVRYKPSADQWSVLEVLAHVEEANQFWMKELKDTIQNPGRRWGRTLQNEARLAAVAKAPGRSVHDVVTGVRRTKDLIDRTLSGVDDAQLTIESESVNPKFGSKPLAFILEHFMVEHLEGHLNQIRRNINAYQATQKEGQ